MQNAEEVHVTGTGTSQEQFTHYMAGTPQFKISLPMKAPLTK